jgi:putative phosphoesterase
MIGVISDTHGLLRPEALAALRGSSHILHAGDVGDIDILDALKQIAPVTAIRGNIDTDGPTAQLPATEVIELEGHLIYLLHSLADLDLKPEAAGMSVVISGHSHKPKVETRNGVLYLNPGSAGPRRFSLPITVAHLHLDATPRAEIVTLSSQE